jgi:hypothetical protein
MENNDVLLTWDEAQDVMVNGGIVESQVSFTRYEMLKNGVMLAEGQVIDERYIKDEEYDGGWKQVEYLKAETKEDLMNIPDEDIQKELSNAYKKAKFDMEYRNK